MKEEEIQLIEGLKAGEEEAFHSLFERYYLTLSAFAGKYLNDIEVARDIVQDLFVHLYEKRHTLLITASLKSYLYQSVQNRCMNHLNSLKRRDDHHQNIGRTGDHATELEEQIMATELEQKIFQNINELPEQCKKIFLMNRMEGKRNGEIAASLNISKRTVETQISKALKILRDHLKDYHQ